MKKAAPRTSTACSARVCVMNRKPTRSALRNRSAGSAVSRDARRQRASTTRTPMEDSASSAKTSQGPTDAISTPAIAGPMAREMLMPMLLSATAAGSSSAGTSSGTIADHAGIISAVPTPTAKLKASSDHGWISPSAASTASEPITMKK